MDRISNFRIKSLQTLSPETKLLQKISNFRIKNLQTLLDDQALIIPKMRRNVNISNMRWLLRNIHSSNNHIEILIGRVETIIEKIKEILKELKLWEKALRL